MQVLSFASILCTNVCNHCPRRFLGWLFIELPSSWSCITRGRPCNQALGWYTLLPLHIRSSGGPSSVPFLGSRYVCRAFLVDLLQTRVKESSRPDPEERGLHHLEVGLSSTYFLPKFQIHNSLYISPLGLQEVI